MEMNRNTKGEETRNTTQRGDIQNINTMDKTNKKTGDEKTSRGTLLRCKPRIITLGSVHMRMKDGDATYSFIRRRNE